MEEKKYETECKGCGKPLKGVMCDVKNCVYHNAKNECCAGTISVGPHNAGCSSDTVCVTFKPKVY